MYVCMYVYAYAYLYVYNLCWLSVDIVVYIYFKRISLICASA